MTREDIKAIYPMREVIARYGLSPNRAGFILCPFHKEKSQSMKIYEQSYFCFGCGSTGDVFTFIMRMDNISFKEAFYQLGGVYEKPTFRSRVAVYKAKKAMEERALKEARLKAKRKLNNMLITIYRRFFNQSEPLSDGWCDSYNALQYQLYLHEHLNTDEKRW